MITDFYGKEAEETAAEYFERRKKEIYARAAYKEEVLKDMSVMKMVLDNLLMSPNNRQYEMTADELVDALNNFFDERGITSPTVIRSVFVYVCELRCL